MPAQCYHSTAQLSAALRTNQERSNPEKINKINKKWKQQRGWLQPDQSFNSFLAWQMNKDNILVMQEQLHLKPVTAVENFTKRKQCICFSIKYILKSTVQRCFIHMQIFTAGCWAQSLGNTQDSNKGLATLSLIFLRPISEGYKNTTTKSTQWKNHNWDAPT